MNGKSKKKLMYIQIKNFQKTQTNWPAIIKLLEWAINRKNYKPNAEFSINITASETF